MRKGREIERKVDVVDYGSEPGQVDGVKLVER